MLIATYELVTAATAQNRRIEPAAEWLLDNFYLVEEQIRSIRRLLPPSFSRELPRLADGPNAELPRVYGIALELIAHVDGRVDACHLNGFVAAYQSVQPLKLGELWALPLMLRLALIENLRRVAIRVAVARRQRDSATDWAERMISVAASNPTDLILVLADLARANVNLTGAFLAELTFHLQSQNPSFAIANTWLEQRLTDQGLSIEQLVRAEGQSQAADQISIGNSISSLRFLNSNDWREFVDVQSVVEQTLASETSGIYETMDFSTRDRYRHAVEGISRRSQLTELEVARGAVQLAAKHAREQPDARAAHVGYYLVDRGRPELERLVKMRSTPTVIIDRVRRKIPLACYLITIAIVTCVATGLLLTRVQPGQVSPFALFGLGISAVICASTLGVALANWLATQLLHPQSLPRLDFSRGIPDEHRTLVAIPTMLTSPAAIERLLNALELRYLSNRETNLHFALLTDFVDAASATLPGDTELLRLAHDGIADLNAKYAPIRDDIFYLFHRSRQWNAQEGVWMGCERKRGKLSDLNAMLRGESERFSDVVGQTAILQSVRYVITLDSDTQLPRDTAHRMIGTLAHPLNRPAFDPKRGRVVDGYTILQPRVDVNLQSARRSRFVQLYADNPGIDPYTRVVSDVYQDLFDEGSFIGKGIYDVDSFIHCCDNFPDNTILSHDLIEGAYGRSALLSDVTLYEDHPASYATDIERRHRWMRGDWQIAAWLLPRVRGRDAQRVANPISALSRWKIFDNLRRSTAPIAAVILLLTSWLMSPAIAMSVLVFLTLIVFLPPVLAGLTSLVHKPVDLPLALHLRTTTRSLTRPFGIGLLTLLFLPYEAYISGDAILRTLLRVGWTKRQLLQWRTASDSEAQDSANLAGAFRSMAFAPVLAVTTLATLALAQPQTLPLAAPLLAAWGASPLVAWWLSRTLPKPEIRFTETQHDFLATLSRQTWRYFEHFVSAEDNWLPPDNVQFNPDQVIASRTSPTNIGMALNAFLAAYDFGYCSADQLLTRTQQTLATLFKLERHRGHFFNWYDTRTLMPLHPRYISTVDSGNLAGNLLVLASGCVELSDGPILPPRLFGGLGDTLRALRQVAQASQRPSDTAAVLGLIDGQFRTLGQTATGLRASDELLSRLATGAKELSATVAAFTPEDPELTWWATAYERACLDHQADLQHLAAWLKLPPPPQSLARPNPQPSGPSSDQPGESWLQLGQLLDRLDRATLREVAAVQGTALPLIETLLTHTSGEASAWLSRLNATLETAVGRACRRIERLEQVAIELRELAEMDFELLYSSSRDLFAIGYNLSEARMDSSFYDLLASEARLASFIVIAQGHYGQEHWFSMGRLLTSTGSVPALLSWSGSMFEYLMPLLVMPNYENTVLDSTYQSVVRRQIEYGRQRGVPWGISESGYNAIDLHKTYQYRAFGVPGLGLKRGLADDLVIAPYASALALMVAPQASCQNLQRLAAAGQQGDYGFYEAVDYTPSRLPPGVESVTIRQFMAHHQGMTLLALAYVLLDKPMQRRFLADPVLRSADLLLQERVPKTVAPVYPHAKEARATRLATPQESGTMRVISDPNRAMVEAHLLSNGHYHVAISSAGGGYSRWGDIAVTRWREDATRDHYGSFCYLRDLDNGALWSNACQPTNKSCRSYEAIFTQARAEFRRTDDEIEAYTQISISPEDDVELRRVTLTNRSERARTIEVTSYSEVVLASQAQDEAHSAFSNLFVQTELIRDRQAIFCTRRPRSAEERPPWMMHLMTVRGTTILPPSFETDRMRFIGRARTLAAPAAMDGRAALSDTQGPVLDPIVSIRQTLVLQPNESVRVDLITGVADSRKAIEALAERFQDSSLADRVLDLAWTHSLILLQQLGISDADAQVYGRLAGAIIYASSLHRAKASTLARNRQGQSGLWAYGISGDVPIVLLRIRDQAQIALVRQALQAHTYWRLKGLTVDLVIWNEDDSVYRQTLQDAIVNAVAASPEVASLDRPGGIFIRRGEQMSEEDRALLQSVARVVLLDDRGTFAEQAERQGRIDASVPYLKPTRRLSTQAPQTTPPSPRHQDLAFFNGMGGFSQDGREYVTSLAPGQSTPAPWVNVIANAQFGTVISESGSSYTWSENSHEFRITPWHNDPVGDTSGEAIYIRDEETGQFWSPTPLPARGPNTYVARHGFGYSIFDHTADGVTTELCVYVATDSPVKFYKLKLTNRSGRARQLSVTGYWELVLGDSRGKSLMHITTELDPVSGAIFARNVYSPEFGDRIATFNCSESIRTFTADRTEFLGRNGNPASPSAMRRTRLSGHTGAGYDPCAAIQTPLALADGQERTITFTVGAARGIAEAKSLAQRFRSVDSAHRAIERVWAYWSQTLGAVHVETPDAAVNFLANGWLVYQTLACRMWARSGFYQSGGAFGFRDQLQDAMALVHAQPQLLRSHLLLAASHQFREGDVQHWWHPPVGRGVRTQFSDDYLWLPLAICRYVRMTGDTGVLEERAHFLQSRLLRDDEEAFYDLPQHSEEVGTLYEHGLRAIDRGLRFGEHGLPLMGCGDWNDGMNLVGQHGRGESVWLAFFMYHVLTQFADLARLRGDTPTADRLTIQTGRLRGNIDQHGWDGNWYRRAYFDDGTPLGSAENEECQIDAISQSWSILSGAGTPERTESAMRSVARRLIRDDARLILLLDPPFDKSDLNPGYIKGYQPGVRENGGQYTHSAIWTVMAAAARGDREQAWEWFRMINPIAHGTTESDIATYRVEPYVVAADVYGVAPHTGRGGWTWYTGSAGWMYRLIIESLLGLRLEVDRLYIEPCIPADWTGFKIHYRYRESVYHIAVRGSGSEIRQMTRDGKLLTEPWIRLDDDQQHHQIEIDM